LTLPAGTYNVIGSNAPGGYTFVNCGAGGGTVSGDSGSASQNGVVTPDNNTTVTFFVQLIPEAGVQAAAVLAADITVPDTGHRDLIQGLLLALLMVLLGAAVLLGQAYYRRVPGRLI
jgi:hypothetical protein